MTNFGTLHLGDVIMHQVPGGRRRDGADDPIQYSEAPIELPERERGFITTRLRGSLGIGARPVVEDDDNDLPTPDIIRELFQHPERLVDCSRELARQLYAKQKHLSSPGLVMVLNGVLRKDVDLPVLVVAKMEHEVGMQVEPTEVNGKKTYKAEYLANLVLGQGTKVFKVGAFLANGAQPGQKLQGEVVDAQQSGRDVADYFVEFFGCRFVQRPDVLTEAFFKATQAFVRRATRDDPQVGAEYQIALLAEMQNQSDRLTPTQFAQNNIRPDDRDVYIQALTSAGVAMNGFRKDVSLVATSIARVKVHTSRGATVLAPPDMYEDGAVAITELEDGHGQSEITVRDEVTSIGGASKGAKRAGDGPA